MSILGYRLPTEVGDVRSAAFKLGLEEDGPFDKRQADAIVAAVITVRHALQRQGGKLVLVEPKSATSHRVVALPALVADALRVHYAEQHRSRLLAGPRWRRDELDLVFTTTIGTPLDGIAVTRRFQRLLRQAGLRHQRFHDLRHACASLLLAQGISPRVVMETLGHSQVSLTLGTYSHVVPSLGRQAAERMNELLGGGSGGFPRPSPHRTWQANGVRRR